MKNFIFLAAGLLFSAALFAGDDSVVNWDLLNIGSWEEGKTLSNRVDLRFNFPSTGLALRAEILDRRPLNFEFEQFALFGDPEKWVTNFLGGLYHNPTGSRLLFGVLDEWGLSARIRNPWIRSPPYSENHRPLIADLKTTVSVTKNDEVYLYLSTPFLDISQNVKWRGFVSAQTETEEFKPALGVGLEFKLPNRTGLLFEGFFTGATLPPTKNSSWFTSPPPLPERDFKLYAAGLLFYNQELSVSADFAVSETFAWGTGVYANFGINLTPLISIGRIARPLSVSFSADGAGKKFMGRDGANHGEGFRAAAKIEWKAGYNSLLRISSVLRSPVFGEGFTRSSTGFYYRFPSKSARDEGFYPVQLTRISFNTDRNADNLQKITDKFTGYIGFTVNLSKIGINSPFGVNISGSIAGLTESNAPVSPYPFPDRSWIANNAGINCEFTWSLDIFQFNSKIGCTFDLKNEEKLWEFSLGAAARFKHGRLSVKVASPDFPQRWNFTVSWRFETGN